MKRRRFLAGTGIAAATALAGCLGGNPAPPRRSNVVSQMSMTDGNTLRVDLADDPSVESTEDFGSDVEPANAGLSPIGVARGAKGGGGGGKGATGRADGGWASAPKTGKGRAKYHGGGYAGNWRDSNEDKFDRYDATIAAVGIAYLGTQLEVEDDAPEPGPVPWDREVNDPKDEPTFTVDQTGWYRVGTELERRGGPGDLGWECIDFRVDDAGSGMEIENQWKVSPRL